MRLHVGELLLDAVRLGNVVGILDRDIVETGLDRALDRDIARGGGPAIALQPDDVDAILQMRENVRDRRLAAIVDNDNAARRRAVEDAVQRRQRIVLSAL